MNGAWCISAALGATIWCASVARSDEFKVRVAVPPHKATIDKALANVAEVRRKQYTDAYLPLLSPALVKTPLCCHR